MATSQVMNAPREEEDVTEGERRRRLGEEEGALSPPLPPSTLDLSISDADEDGWTDKVCERIMGKNLTSLDFNYDFLCQFGEIGGFLLETICML